MTSPALANPAASPGRSPVWLFSAPVDLTVFLGSAGLSLALLAWGHYAGLLTADTPDWAWIPFVLLVDVAHVYATAFRVYFDRQELQRRPLLYVGVPVLAFAIGWAVHSESPVWFWRALAYFAVFHFVRQQYGWVALYRAKAGEPGGWERALDTAAIYLATLYPLIYWHAHLPRDFWWLRERDFYRLPQIAAALAAPIYWTVMGAYAGKAVWQWCCGRANPGKDIVVATTALCWHLGIITFNSDYAFTVTNVIIHGVPYFALVLWYVRGRRQAPQRFPWWRWLFLMLATAWLLAYIEELFWHRFLWQERSWLFGPAQDVPPSNHHWLAALLATPQLTHYILDGFIWRRRTNPGFRLRDSQEQSNLSADRSVDN